jgi:hypothetical protein
MRRSQATFIVLGLLLFAAAPASAAKIKHIGRVAPSGAAPGNCGSCEAFSFSTAASSPSYVVPQGRWRIISWAAQGNTADPAHARLWT